VVSRHRAAARARCLRRTRNTWIGAENTVQMGHWSMERWLARMGRQPLDAAIRHGTWSRKVVVRWRKQHEGRAVTVQPGRPPDLEATPGCSRGLHQSVDQRSKYTRASMKLISTSPRARSTRNASSVATTESVSHTPQYADKRSGISTHAPRRGLEGHWRRLYRKRANTAVSHRTAGASGPRTAAFRGETFSFTIRSPKHD